MNNYLILAIILINIGNKNSIRKIVAMAISPSIEQITLYNNEGNIYLFSSKFDKKKRSKIRK